MSSLKVSYAGFNGLRKSLLNLDRSEVQVGFFDKMYPGTPNHVFPEGYNVGMYVAEVAYLNNINTNDSPARPFMEETITDEKTIQNVHQAIKKIISGASINATLRRLGESEVLLMKKIIEEYSNYDHNSEGWIEEKGFDDVLQFTDFMLESVEYRIEHKA